MPGMHKDPRVSFFMTAWCHPSQIDSVVADSVFFFGHNDHIWGLHTCYLISQKVEQLGFVVIFSQEVLPLGGDFEPVTLRLTPCPRFDLVSAFRLDGR